MIVELTLEQKQKLIKVLPQYPQKQRGRKRKDTVKVLEGILFVLKTGARWEDIDKYKYAAPQTCHAYFQEWVENGTFLKILETLCEGLEDEDLLDLRESFLDGCFIPAKKGAIRSV
jgi:transposase